MPLLLHIGSRWASALTAAYATFIVAILARRRLAGVREARRLKVPALAASTALRHSVGRYSQEVSALPLLGAGERQTGRVAKVLGAVDLRRRFEAAAASAPTAPVSMR